MAKAKAKAGKKAAAPSKEGRLCRAMTVPVCRAVVGYAPRFGDEAACKEGWAALHRALAASWRDATQAANHCLSRLFAMDCEPLEDGRLPPFAPDTKPLYKECRGRWPGLDSQSFGQLLQNAKAKYAQVRLAVRRDASSSLPTYRYPLPLPVPAKDSALALAEGGAVTVRLRAGGARLLLLLKSTDNFARQLGPLRLAAGGAGGEEEAEAAARAQAGPQARSGTGAGTEGWRPGR